MENFLATVLLQLSARGIKKQRNRKTKLGYFVVKAIRPRDVA